MNTYEKQMLAILEKGRKDLGFVAVKAEFEAEGTRSDEFLRLLELARRAGLKVALKIGGCEAIRDLIEARQYGVDMIIAPMVETPYALSKFIAAKNKVFPAKEQEDMSFLFNVETAATFEHLEELGSVAQAGKVGFVFGRVDFAGSLGKDRGFVNSPEMTAYVNRVAQEARIRGVELVVGGGVSPDRFRFSQAPAATDLIASKPARWSSIQSLRMMAALRPAWNSPSSSNCSG